MNRRLELWQQFLRAQDESKAVLAELNELTGGGHVIEWIGIKDAFFAFADEEAASELIEMARIHFDQHRAPGQ
jgi:hypothetical protein